MLYRALNTGPFCWFVHALATILFVVSTPTSSLLSRHKLILAKRSENCDVAMREKAEKASTSQMDRFREGLRQVLSVPKSELKRLLEEEKASKAGKLKPGPKPKSSSVPA